METILQRIAQVEGVIQAILVGKDGLVVAGTLDGSEDEEVLGAMAAACFSAITHYSQEIGAGEMRQTIIQSAHGTLHLAEIDDLILVVSTTPQVNLGRIRLEMARIGQHIAERVGTY
jgi:predicted regulator of Ras-like GTPase activity (Roadblock/LC7/MglB family)